MKSEPSPEAIPFDISRILETVHSQQSQIHGMLATLDLRSRELDTTLGDAVQRAFTDAVGIRATDKLSQLHRATGVRFARWSFGIVGACALVPALMSWALLPSRSQILEARQSLERLSAGAAQLSRQGGRIDLRQCGPTRRLCVRVDRKSPFYGDTADYMILKDY